jgi:hypothetical protein
MKTTAIAFAALAAVVSAQPGTTTQPDAAVQPGTTPQPGQPGAPTTSAAPVVDNNNNNNTNNQPINNPSNKSVLPPNGTEWLAACLGKTKFDIFNLQGFTTEEESQTISTTRECVDGLNIINTNGQKYLNCELSIGAIKKELGAYINAVLEGRAANSTDSSISASGSNEIELPEASSGSDASVGEEKESSEDVPPKESSKSSATSIALSATAIVAALGAALQ